MRQRHPHHVAWLEADHGAPPRDVGAWLAAGVLRRDDQPTMRVVEQQLPTGHRVVALVGAVSRDDLIPHEQIDPAAVRRRVRRDRDEQVEARPLLAVLDDDPPSAAEVIAGAGTEESRVEDRDGVVHIVRRLDPILAGRLTAELGSHRALLADGHHRVAAAVRTGSHQMLAQLAFAAAPPLLRRVWRIAVCDAAPDRMSAWLAAEGEPDGVVELLYGSQRTRRHPQPAELPVSAGSRLAAEAPGLVRVTTTSDPAAAVIAARDGALVVTATPPTVPEILRALDDGPLPPKSTSFAPKPRVGLLMRER